MNFVFFLCFFPYSAQKNAVFSCPSSYSTKWLHRRETKRWRSGPDRRLVLFIRKRGAGEHDHYCVGSSKWIVVPPVNPSCWWIQHLYSTLRNHEKSQKSSRVGALYPTHEVSLDCDILVLRNRGTLHKAFKTGKRGPFTALRQLNAPTPSPPPCGPCVTH